MGRVAPPLPRLGESRDQYLLRTARWHLRQQQRTSWLLLVIWAAVIAAVIVLIATSL
jgi:hypothetical protein